jgi:hypothetical protein
MFSNFLDEIINNFLSFVSKINIKKSEDKISYSYIKNERLLKKYEEKLNLNTKEIIKNVFSSENREKLLLKRKVIKQNILLLLTKKK